MTETQTQWKTWLVALILAILFHLAFTSIHFDWTHPNSPLQVDIHQVDMKKLEAIRRQWREREKALILDKDKNAPSEKTAPKDARYMSDRNVKVKEEQRARDQNVIPQPGRPGPKAQETVPREEAAKPKTPAHEMPKLGNLGVPFRLNEVPKNQPKLADEDSVARRGGDDAGDQSILDKNLPTGSENLLNMEESIYYSFFARLYEAIGPIWQSRIRSTVPSRRLAPGDYTTAVDVVLDADGNLLAVRLMQSSGVEEFDRAVDTSWHRIGRFPNPPIGLLKNGEVHTGWNFTVELNQTLTPDYLPPERVY